MISIVAKFKVKDVEAFLPIVQEFVIESNKEDGCIEYGLHQDLEDESVFIMNEKWRDQEAIDAHNNSDHFKRLGSKVTEVAEVEVKLFKPIFV